MKENNILKISNLINHIAKYYLILSHDIFRIS